MTEEDLGDLSGKCELCDTALRYEFHIEHPKWFPMIVGTDCCDRLTGSDEASLWRRKQDRLVRFVRSSRWKSIPDGIRIDQMKMTFEITHDVNGFLIRILGKRGKQRYDSVDAAKAGIFNFVEDGRAADFFQRNKGPDAVDAKRR
jgi:hypothetical protein